MKRKKKRKLLFGPVGPDTYTTGVGPLDLDVEMARDFGWSQAQIDRVADTIARLSIQESRRAARRAGRGSIDVRAETRDDVLEKDLIP